MLICTYRNWDSDSITCLSRALAEHNYDLNRRWLRINCSKVLLYKHTYTHVLVSVSSENIALTSLSNYHTLKPKPPLHSPYQFLMARVSGASVFILQVKIKTVTNNKGRLSICAILVQTYTVFWTIWVFHTVHRWLLYLNVTDFKLNIFHEMKLN